MMEDDDLEELKLMFLEECLENIELLEKGLMRMGDGECSPDTLNEVFRAAHSIKGGAASFGYQPMAELTHHMETLLDEMRSGRREVDDADVDLLFDSLDIVRSILEDSRSGAPGDHAGRLGLQKRLEDSVLSIAADDPQDEDGEQADGVIDAGGGSGALADIQRDTPSSSSSGQVDEAAGWQIHFVPQMDFMQRGNDPLLLIREVARLGKLSLAPDYSALPAWKDYNPSLCYLGWRGELTAGVSEAEVREIFEWVESECKLEVIATTAKPVTAAAEDDVPAFAASPAAAGSSAPAVKPVPAAASTPSANTPSAKKPSAKKPSASAAAEENSQAGQASRANAESSSIRIATEKIDQLINMVGELVITQSMLSRVGQQANKIDVQELRERLADLEHHTRDLQESVMQVRMLPISSAFSRLPRLVRDLSRKLGKEVELVTEGGSTELDKTVLERMVDPLVHLVRNSLDHGIETPEQRVAANKPVTGVLELSARQESGNVIIEIKDDGRGIDCNRVLNKAREKGIVHPDDDLNEDQINQLIFAPGFSTADTVSDVSGRGVGMDVVRRNIVDLGGRVHVHSTYGRGTTVVIKLPLSLAILDGQLVRIAKQVFVIPILSIVETMELAQTVISSVPGSGNICRFRGIYLPTVDVAEQFALAEPGISKMIVIVETHRQRTGLLVDEILGQQQVVIKPLEKNYKPIAGLAGATIMSDGAVALILDPNGFRQETAASEAA